ncbi:MAG: phage tail fiber protein [Candidatus Thorarchaeota archaeon]|jgi:hypothetical protein
MSKGNTFENEFLECIFNNNDITLIGDAGGILGSTVPGNLYISLHTANPGEAGNQGTSEIAYTSYARVAIVRTGAAWTVTANSASPAAAITFPAGTGGSGTASYFGVGTASTGSGKLLYSGTVTPNIVCGDGVTPELTTATAITED